MENQGQYEQSAARRLREHAGKEGTTRYGRTTLEQPVRETGRPPRLDRPDLGSPRPRVSGGHRIQLAPAQASPSAMFGEEHGRAHRFELE